MVAMIFRNSHFHKFQTRRFWNTFWINFYTDRAFSQKKKSLLDRSQVHVGTNTSDVVLLQWCSSARNMHFCVISGNCLREGTWYNYHNFDRRCTCAQTFASNVRSCPSEQLHGPQNVENCGKSDGFHSFSNSCGNNIGSPRGDRLVVKQKLSIHDLVDAFSIRRLQKIKKCTNCR